MSHNDTSQHLERRLHYISDVMGTVRDSLDGLVRGRGFDDCLLHVLEKRSDKLKSELFDVTCDILCTHDDERALMADESAIEKALFDLNLKISHLHQDQVKFEEAESIPRDTIMYSTQVTLPKISIPSLDGSLVN